jgi:hypothetical protein
MLHNLKGANEFYIYTSQFMYVLSMCFRSFAEFSTYCEEQRFVKVRKSTIGKY